MNKKNKTFLLICAVPMAMLVALFNLLPQKTAAAATGPQALASACFISVNDSGITDYESAGASAVQTAVNNANPGDLLKIAGTCAGVQSRNALTQTAYISQSLTLRGGYDAYDWTIAPDPVSNPTTIDALALGRVIYITGSVDVTLENLTLTGGEVSNMAGGGIYFAGESLTLMTTELQDNRAYGTSGYYGGYGGGIFALGDVSILSSTIAYNIADERSGGGLYLNDETAVLTIHHSDFISNYADREGGGIYTKSGYTMTHSSFISNTGSGSIYQNRGTATYINHSLFAQNDDGGYTIYQDGPFILLNTVLRENQSSRVIYHRDGRLWISNTQILNNAGEAVDTNNGPALIEHSRFISNSGGGIDAADALTLTHSTIAHNTDDYDSALNLGGPFWIENSLIYSNTITDDDGGGIYLDDGAVGTIINSTISGNKASGYGGGIYIEDYEVADLWLLNSTVTGNTADSDEDSSGIGGGISAYGLGTFTTTNSIISGNMNPTDSSSANCGVDSGGTLVSAGYNVLGTDCDFSLGTDVVADDPLLALLADNGGDSLTHMPLPGSPVIDYIPTGTNGCGTTVITDQRTVSRPYGDGCEIGAFELITYDMTTAVTGSGTITSNPSGINCEDDCTESFHEGTVVTLTATAATGSTFTGWTGSIITTTNPLILTMDEAKSVTATFTLDTHALTVNLNGDGSVSSDPVGIDCGVDCSETYDYGTVVTLTAVSETGFSFTGWTGSIITTTNPLILTIDEAQNVTATFTLDTHALTVNLNGDGSVSSDPAGIDCGVDCSETYDYGTVVTLTAVPETGFSFTGWSGASCSGTNDCVLTMNSAQSVTATFTRHFIYLPIVLK